MRLWECDCMPKPVKVRPEVLKSLEGAVFEATKNPNALRDVRRKQGGR